MIREFGVSIRVRVGLLLDFITNSEYISYFAQNAQVPKIFGDLVEQFGHIVVSGVCCLWDSVGSILD